jgi:hypothetical protein
LLRVLFVRFGQVPANSAEAYLLRLTVLLSLAFGVRARPRSFGCFLRARAGGGRTATVDV